ncbi:MAG: septation protein A [Burkholderiaceae bacterium]|nr:septation protein A [Burkholderiaceae bacterium]
MKLLFDLFPIVLFFVAYKVANIYVATGVAIVASIGQIGWLLARRKPVEGMQWASLAIIVLFGGMTLLLQDETFIKWKPTVLYGLFALVLGGAQLLFGRNLIRSAMGKQIALPEAIWSRLNMLWSAFFVLMAALNLYVAYRFPTDTWVNFKLFGTTGLTLAFVLVQALYVGRHVQEESP